MIQLPVLLGTGLFAAVMLTCGVYILWRQRLWQRRSRRVEGEVVRLEGHRPGLDAGSGRRVWPVVRYRGEDGEERDWRSATAYRRRDVAVGDVLELRYDPERPWALRPTSSAERTAALVALVLAAASVVVMILRLV